MGETLEQMGHGDTEAFVAAVNADGGVWGDGTVELEYEFGAGSCFYQAAPERWMYCCPDWEDNVGVTCQLFDEAGNPTFYGEVELIWNDSNMGKNVALWREIVVGAQAELVGRFTAGAGRQTRTRR